MLFVLKHWKALLTGIVIAGLLVALNIRTGQRDDARLLAERTQAAFDQTVANYHRAAEVARRVDAENLVAVERAQATITQEVSHDYQIALADARARADALRVRLAAASADPRAGGNARLPETGTAASGSDGPAAPDGFPLADRLTATEQAIQLAALQEWVRRQADVAPPPSSPARP